MQQQGSDNGPILTHEGYRELSDKILFKILELVPQTTQQHCRGVCSQWNQLIKKYFPVHLSITNENYERMFQCSTAVTAELIDFTADFSSEPAFTQTLEKLAISGKIVSIHLLNFLSLCPELNTLLFRRLSQVISIQSGDQIELPKLKIVEIELNPTHDTFTSDEIIVWNLLKQVHSKSLERVTINASPSTEWSDEEDDEFDEEFEENGMSYSTVRVEGEASTSQPYLLPTLTYPGPLTTTVNNRTIPIITTTNANNAAGPINTVDEGVGTDSPPPEDPMPYFGSPTLGFLTPRRDDNNSPVGTSTSVPPSFGREVVITLPRARNPAATADNNSGSNNAPQTTEDVSQESIDGLRYPISEEPSQADDNNDDDDGDDEEAQTMESSADMVSNTLFRPSIEFAIRLFRANASPNENSSHSVVVRHPFLPQVQIRRSNGRVNVANIPSPIKHTVFFEFLYQNHSSLKTFQVRTRPDFLCFGHIPNSVQEMGKLQFEELEYSFGRSHLSMEYKLLLAQKKLRTVKMNVMDDMWDFVVQAVSQSANTLEDFDVKVLSISEDPIDFTEFQACHNLRNFKCIFFYEKHGLQTLPVSLVKMCINGPLGKEDLWSFARRLLKLQEFTLILNTGGDRIDLDLFIAFTKLPNLQRFTAIQCLIDLDLISKYCDTETSRDITLSVDGPLKIRELPSLQYVIVTLGPLKE